MKRFVVGLVAAAVLVAMAHTAVAQSKTVRSEMRTETGTIEAIDVLDPYADAQESGRHLRHDRRRAGHHAVRGAQDRRHGQRPVLRERDRPGEAARRG